MIIMKADATQEQIANVIKDIKKHGLRADISRGAYRTVIGLIGDERKIPFDHFASLPGVKEARMIETPYKLISREYNKSSGTGNEQFVVKVGDIEIGGDEPVYIAGPCAVESKKQLFKIAEGVKRAGAHILRGGFISQGARFTPSKDWGLRGRKRRERLWSGCVKPEKSLKCRW